jgi:glycosyltransferase involved in cell wall biosynthesis
MNTNLVTVCITTHNRKELLPLTLNSILNQTYKNIEIIIVDDFSNDGTKELIENELLKLDDRIRFIRHEENKGLAAGRNTAVFNAKGKYFTFCDDDDEWMSNFVEEFVKESSKYDDNWCFSCFNFTGNKNNYTFEGTLKQAIINGLTPPVASQFYHTNTLKKIGGYNNLSSGVDHDLWLTLSFNNIKLKVIPKELSTPNRFSTEHSRMTNTFDKRVEGINTSLEYWKVNITQHFGINFFNHFRREYTYYNFRNFLKKSITDKNIILFVKVVNYGISKRIVFKLFSELLILNKRNVNEPLFKGFM